MVWETESEREKPVREATEYLLGLRVKGSEREKPVREATEYLLSLRVKGERWWLLLESSVGWKAGGGVGV
ncbi:MAG: hypothetical protein GY821_06285 [Gammaproteobacteria bacterium]|nr:hypothetical protein [Gammaproteobacteria bacterium]